MHLFQTNRQFHHPRGLLASRVDQVAPAVACQHRSHNSYIEL